MVFPFTWFFGINVCVTVMGAKMEFRVSEGQCTVYGRIVWWEMHSRWQVNKTCVCSLITPREIPVRHPSFGT
ncbi:hypothetical protein K504DRAFT_167036 [Pleomassaria siparia CBS 279.74]|uniref:Secreted protein n=1 Tax=Pleomassaria siparia CBS 279.74 TaxID=1314801 RepID=A0A6G1JUI0_9PLEO|nr:hypothetical protein K504DRAFT_167036 [Pleomassaria siparia CBS 279.74]